MYKRQIIQRIYRDVFWVPKGADLNREVFRSASGDLGATDSLVINLTDFNFQAGRRYRVNIDLDVTRGIIGSAGTSLTPWRRQISIPDSGSNDIYLGEEVSFTFTSVGGENIQVNAKRLNASTPSRVGRGFIRVEEINNYSQTLSRF